MTKIRYSFQFLNRFETLDISETIIVMGQYFLLGFNLIYKNGLIIFNTIFLVSISAMFIVYVISDIHSYYFNMKIKDLYLQILLNEIHHHLKGNEKQYYLRIAEMFKNKPLLSSEKIPKFFTLFSILLTFIPIITYLFIYS